MNSDLEDCSATCDRPNGESERANLQPTDNNWKVVTVTILGPFTQTAVGNSWIAVLLDPVTLWIDATPLQCCNCTTLANFLFNSFTLFGFCQCYFIGMENCLVHEIDTELKKRGTLIENKHGCVKTMLQNSGETCENTENVAVYAAKKIFRLCPPTYVKGILSTHSNSEISVLGKKFAEILSNNVLTIQECVAANPQTWDTNLPNILFALRVTTCSSDGNSPFYAMFRRLPYCNWKEVDIKNIGDMQFACSNANENDQIVNCNVGCKQSSNDNEEVVILKPKHEQCSLSSENSSSEIMLIASCSSEKLKDSTSIIENYLCISDSQKDSSVNLDDSFKEDQEVGLQFCGSLTQTNESDDDDGNKLDSQGHCSQQVGELNELHVTIVADYPAEEVMKKHIALSNEEKGESTEAIEFDDEMMQGVTKQKVRKFERELPFKCPKCSATYLATNEELQLHLKCHVLGQKFLQCPQCPKTMKNWSHLQRHLLSHEEVVSLIRLLPEDDRKCNVCGKVFQTRERMIRHEQTHLKDEWKFECQFCGRKYRERKTFARHLDLHANNLYRCEHCSYKTKIRKNFTQHSKIHEGRGFQCHICSKIFSKSSTLTVHLDVHNSNRTQYECDQCGVKLAHGSSLRQHILNVHQKPGSYSCDHCNYTGKSKSNLLSHLNRAHNKPLKCDKCSYSCKSESALKRHDDIVHNESERQFACTACTYRARDSRQLKEHIRFRHNPNSLRFLCHFCNTKFKTMTMLRHHLPVHTGQHLYNCQLCGYSAKYRQTLHHHVKTRHPEHRPSDIIRGTPSSSISCTLAGHIPLDEALGDDVQQECSEYIEEVIVSNDHDSALIVANICETGNVGDNVVVECEDIHLLASQGNEIDESSLENVNVHENYKQSDKAVELLLLAVDPHSNYGEINQVASEEMVQTTCG